MKLWPPAGSVFVLVATLLASLTACTRPNPEFCCLTEEDCAQQGVSEVRTCQRDQVCTDHACRTVQCETAAQCAGTEAPYCVNQLCASACTLDLDCAGAAGPLCADDGVCVGCESNADCPASAPVCDPATRACAPCHNDADCASGVCLAADGRCAEATELIYVSEGGSNETSCTRREPCKTLEYALSKAGPNRNVIRLLGTMFIIPTEVQISSQDVYIDAERTQLIRPGAGRLLTVSGTSQVTIEGIKISTRGFSDYPIGISTNSRTTRLTQIEASSDEDFVRVYSGSLEIIDSQLRNSGLGYGVLCTGSHLEVRGSTLLDIVIAGAGCTGNIHGNIMRNVLLSFNAPYDLTNNLVEVSRADCRGNYFGARRISFNTFVCRSTPPVSGEFMGRAITGCLNGTEVTNNILAWDSVTPITSDCWPMAYNNTVTRDAQVQLNDTNLRAGPSELFVDPLAQDYQLKGTSPARAAGQADPRVTTDLQGRKRPSPPGTPPDLGAYEAP